MNKIFDKLHIFIDKHNSIKLLINNYNLLQFARSSDEQIDKKNYQYAIDNIMYAIIYIRFDIVFAIKQLSQYFVDLTKHYNQILKVLFRYLRFIVDKELIYNNNKSLYLVTYLNSNYVANKLNRKSILDYVFIISEKLIT